MTSAGWPHFSPPALPNNLHSSDRLRVRREAPAQRQLISFPGLVIAALRRLRFNAGAGQRPGRGCGTSWARSRGWRLEKFGKAAAIDPRRRHVEARDGARAPAVARILGRGKIFTTHYLDHPYRGDTQVLGGWSYVWAGLFGPFYVLANGFARSALAMGFYTIVIGAAAFGLITAVAVYSAITQSAMRLQSICFSRTALRCVARARMTATPKRRVAVAS